MNSSGHSRHWHLSASWTSAQLTWEDPLTLTANRVNVRGLDGHSQTHEDVRSTKRRNWRHRVRPLGNIYQV
ncbi:hypothetical transcript [Echinococcus multilocularis]|uniref:Hypothetical transcript n=1 Tax=Echinococcus multilocularis TaxID=6211 RepID=A0A068Y0B4_ECHMU|nr:hypothetical transcript [Echinococcus multilocularis]